MSLRLNLFGSPRIECDGESVVLPFERRSQLLTLLAVKRTWIGRPELASMLWPEQAHKQAYANLRKTLFRLQDVPWASGIDVQGNAVRLQAQTDVYDFESALRERRIADALPMRSGELLAGFDDDHSEAWTSWLSFERDRTRVAWRAAALDRLNADIEPAQGIELSAQLLEADPLDEAALRAHMQWLAHSGQSAGACHAYEKFAERLAQDLGLDPSAELEALHDALGNGSTRCSPAQATPAPAPDNGFIGRSVELRRIAELLAQDDGRLLCLIGPGGVGKTRLAQRAIQELAPHYTQGVAFISVEDVGAPSELGTRLARELGVALGGTREPIDQVIDFLRERHMLLALDNFEQFAAAAQVLDKLLQSCARLKLIVTSRVRLSIASEWLLPLEGLPCPEMEDLDRIEAFDAVRLFVKAARRVAPTINPATEAAAIVDICRQVEGLPLALELAAAWTRVLSCEAIATELRQGSELLRARDASHGSRHASFERVFDHSWRLLSESERAALARLSVFRGGFTVEAARAVAGASLPVLGALADKSLVRKEGARIFLHPLVQQLAALRLIDSEAQASTQAAHGSYFHRLLAQLRQPVEKGDREALQQVDAEFENCRIAWQWAVAHRGIDALLKSVMTLLRFCDYRGRFNEGLSLFNHALDSSPPRATPELAAMILGAAAHLEFRLNQYAVAEATAAQALEKARLASDPRSQALCLGVLGLCCSSLGQHDNARRFLKQAHQQALADADPRKAADMLVNQALVDHDVGDYAEALRLSTQTLAHYRRFGDVAGEAVCLNNLGALLLDTREFESAAVHLKEALALCDRHGLASTRVYVLSGLTELAIKSGDYDSARTYAERTLDFAQAGGYRHLVSESKLQFVLLALQRGDLFAARTDLEAALRIGIAIGQPSLQLEGVACFAEILAAQSEAACAHLLLAFVVEHPSTDFSDRNESRQRLAQWHHKPGAEPSWPGIELDELVRRIVAETAVAHAPLIALLRASK